MVDVFISIPKAVVTEDTKYGKVACRDTLLVFWILIWVGSNSYPFHHLSWGSLENFNENPETNYCEELFCGL